MSILDIILITCGIITALTFLCSIYLAISEWRDFGNIKWSYLVLGFFFIPALLYAVFRYIVKEREKCKDKKEYKKQIKHLKEENEHIVKFYDEDGNIIRYKMPRTLDGIRQFEFNEFFTNSNQREFIYIENAYNEVLNEFFKKRGHLSFNNGIKVWYLPKLVEELTDEEIIRYYNPGSSFRLEKISNITTDCLLADLEYPEDAEKIKHGIISLDGFEYNSYDMKFVKTTYFPLKEGDDACILSQIESIVKEKSEMREEVEDCSHKQCNNLDGKEEVDDSYADEHFNRQVYNDDNAILIDEVRERVERLRQYGISENILMKMIQVKPKLSRLVITQEFRILLPDYDNMEIKMDILDKAVYFWFLRNKDGIVFDDLSFYKYELWRICINIMQNAQNNETTEAINDICNSCLNSINEKCARIRGAFISQFDESLAKNYFIKGDWGQPKKIVLPRDLVIWEGKL